MLRFLVLLCFVVSGAMVQMPSAEKPLLDQIEIADLIYSPLDEGNKCCAEEAMQKDKISCPSDAKAVLSFAALCDHASGAQYLPVSASVSPSVLHFLDLRPPIS